MYLKDRGKVALVLGNLCRQEGAVGQAQEHLNPRLSSAPQSDFVSLGKRSTHPQPSTREAQPGMGSTWRYLLRRCLQEGHTGSTQGCLPPSPASHHPAGELGDRMGHGGIMLMRAHQRWRRTCYHPKQPVPIVSPVPHFQRLIRAGTVRTRNRGNSVRYWRWHARRGQHTQAGRWGRAARCRWSMQGQGREDS